MIGRDEVCRRPDLLRIGGRWLEETYFAFQFDHLGVRPDLGRLVMALREAAPDDEIAYWLVQPNRLLDGYSPLRWITSGHDLEQVRAVARRAGPAPDRAQPAPSLPPATGDAAARERTTLRRRPAGYSFG